MGVNFKPETPFVVSTSLTDPAVFPPLITKNEVAMFGHVRVCDGVSYDSPVSHVK